MGEEYPIKELMQLTHCNSGTALGKSRDVSRSLQGGCGSVYTAGFISASFPGHSD